MALAIGASDIEYEVVEAAPTIRVMLRRENHDSIGVMGRETSPDGVISVADATALIIWVLMYERYGRPDRVEITETMATEIRRATERKLEQFITLMAKHDVVPA
jgi:hypothetical protein